METNESFSQKYQNIESIKNLLKTQTYGMIIQSGFFKNTIPYADAVDYKINKVCEHCGSKYKDEDARRKLRLARAEWQTEENRLYSLFKEGLILSVGLEYHEKSQKAFELAWDRGHANGYYEVYQEFEDLAELIK